MYRTGDARAHAARRRVRGAYRAPGGPPKAWLVRQKKTEKYPAPGVQVTAAVIKGKIRMWHYVDGPWCAQNAADMYEGPLLASLKKAYPGKRHFVVLEDNDPAGYKSRKGLQAKAAANITTLDLPRRSPDLNVLDYTLWAEINKRMRAQEETFRASKKESKAAYMERLRRTAIMLPKSVVTTAVKAMSARTKKVAEAKGGLIEV